MHPRDIDPFDPFVYYDPNRYKFKFVDDEFIGELRPNVNEYLDFITEFVGFTDKSAHGDVQKDEAEEEFDIDDGAFDEIIAVKPA